MTIVEPDLGGAQTAEGPLVLATIWHGSSGEFFILICTFMILTIINTSLFSYGIF